MSKQIYRMYISYLVGHCIPTLVMRGEERCIDYDGITCTLESDHKYTFDSVQAFRFKYGVFK